MLRDNIFAKIKQGKGDNTIIYPLDRGRAVGSSGTAPQDGRSQVLFLVRFLEIFKWSNPSVRISVVMVSVHPFNRNEYQRVSVGVKCGRRV